MGQQVLTNQGIIKGQGTATFRKSTVRAVNTTVAATDLLNGEITLPILLAAASVRIKAIGDWMNNSGGAVVQPRFQLLLGGVTLLDTNVPGTGVNASATRHSWTIDAHIANLNATNSQSAALRGALSYGTLAAGAATVGFLTGTGGYGQVAAVAGAQFEGGVTGAAANTAVATALVLNVINGSASASYETRLYHALIEIL